MWDSAGESRGEHKEATRDNGRIKEDTRAKRGNI